MAIQNLLQCEFYCQISRRWINEIDELVEIELEEKLRHPLYVEFCSKEKIPFRIAYEHEDFFIVSRNIEEIKLKK